MANVERVELTVLGRTLALRSAADPAYLRALATFVEDRVATLTKGGVRDPQTALLMAALDISDELFRLRDEQARDDRDVGARLDALRAILDDAGLPDRRP